MKSTKIFFGNVIALLGLMAAVLPALPVYAQPEDSEAVTTAPADKPATSEVDQQTLMDQINLFFHIGDTTRELNMEDSGISGLNDTAGQSVGEKQLLLMKEQYRKQLEKNSDDEATWASLGSVLETLGEEDLSLDAYRQAVRINSENQAALQGIKRIGISHRVLSRVYYSFQHQEEYAPSIDRYIATWEEQAMTVQVSKSWGQGKTLGVGWLESTIYQKNEIYGDVDFFLKRRAPFVNFSWPIMEHTSMAVRVRQEKFTNNNDTGYYRVDGSEEIVTGYLALAFLGDGFWTNLNYSREREPDPVYDVSSGRSALNIEVKQLSGISGGFALAPSWELGSSIYYEQYGSNRKDQFNPNIQLSHWMSSVPGTRLSLGYGYYSEERENITNLTASYQWQPLRELLFRFEYQLEYSGNEDSLLNQGDLLMNWTIIDQLSMVVRADYSQESGGDKDNNFYVQASLNWSLY